MAPPVLADLLAELTGGRRLVAAGGVAGIDLPDGAEVVDLDHAPEPRRSRCVALVVDDVRELRALALPRLGRTRNVVLVVRAAAHPIRFTPLPTWPAVTVESRDLSEGVVTVFGFADLVAAQEVYAVLAAAAGDPEVSGSRGLVVGFMRGQGQPVPPADPSYLEITAGTAIDELVVPPDVVLSSQPLPLAESPVTGRVPLVVDASGDTFVDEGLPGDHDPAVTSYAWRRRLAERAGVDFPAPVPAGGEDPVLPHRHVTELSPIGFDTHATAPVRALSELDASRPPGAHVEELRDCLGVRVDTDERPELVTALSAGGVPLVRPGDDVDLTDPLAREELSIRTRREALDARGHPRPSVSVLLATRRPELLDHAIAQVTRQRGAEIELVLAPHGFEPDLGRVRELAGDLTLEVVARPAATLFGRVLADASAVSSGEVLLKMDDDDWYGPDVVADLLRARDYSGAPVVGSAADFMYLTDRDVTIRQHFPSEKYTNFVAGGTLMIDAGLLRMVGGFRSVRRYVDAQLLSAVRSVGAAIYRTHGLGYVLRRNPTGHTWTLAADDLIEDGATATPGWAPSRLLEHPTP